MKKKYEQNLEYLETNILIWFFSGLHGFNKQIKLGGQRSGWLYQLFVI